MEKKFGVNVFGYINGEFGLGEAVRLLIKAMESANIPLALINYDVETAHRHNDNTYKDFVIEAPYSINLILLGPTEAKRILMHFGNIELFQNKYTIFFLNWESESFPQEYVANISYYDEIWTPAQYCKNVISKFSNVPVDVVRYPIDILVSDKKDKESEEFYDSSKFNFLFMFDYNSSLERKNTLNLVKAFEIAFGKDDISVCLTIKTSSSSKYITEKTKLLESIKGFKNIKIVEKIFEKDTLHKIIRGCDSYISLHRSEGFGLTMAEAMFFGKPVIATGYSGNKEFMNSENSFLVDYEMCKIDSGTANYDENTIWSNPDIKHAAEQLKKVKSNSAEVKEISLNGFNSIKDNFSTIQIGNEIKIKLEKIIKNFKVNHFKDDLILTYLENEKMKSELTYIKRSNFINLIMKFRYYFRDRKKAKRLARKNKL